MPVLLQLAGFLCLSFAFTLMCRPRVRPSPAAYTLAIAVDGVSIAFTLGVLAMWPRWWLLVPLTLWAGALWLHILRLRDARVMVRVLESTYPPIQPPQCHHPPYDPEHHYRDHEDWPPTWHR